jgi:hypothetical protein
LPARIDPDTTRYALAAVKRASTRRTCFNEPEHRAGAWLIGGRRTEFWTTRRPSDALQWSPDRTWLLASQVVSRRSTIGSGCHCTLPWGPHHLSRTMIV